MTVQQVDGGLPSRIQQLIDLKVYTLSAWVHEQIDVFLPSGVAGKQRERTEGE